MDNSSPVLEYKCPCCDAGLVFSQDVQQMKCPYCDNVFDLDAVQSYSESLQETPAEDTWNTDDASQWTQEDEQKIRMFTCPSCAGEIITDDTTAATFCPYCGNPTVMPGRVSGGLKPDAIIPFKLGKEDAKAAFLNLCKGKPLLPKFFTQEQQLEKITGMYVPFWLYNCSASFTGSYKATRVQTWSDANYIYTKTDHYLLRREASCAFERIPMDGSTKVEDTFMESIEPYDYSALIPFDMAYLSGYLADKYDVESDAGKERIRHRAENSITDRVKASILGYATAIPTAENIHLDHGDIFYVLLPVWILNTRYKDKIYTFAMNGQTGKMTGAFPICPKRTAAWFAGICAGVTALVSIVMALL